jgi:hypothetical protein
MTIYDPAVIQRSADRLYTRAALVPVVSALLGALIGLVGAPYILPALPAALALHCPDWVPALVLGIVGLGQGLERGAQLRLQAQVALCQLEIERNTRGQSSPVKP